MPHTRTSSPTRSTPHPRPAQPSSGGFGPRTGALGKGCAIGLGAAALLLLAFAAVAIGGYNALVAGQEDVSQRWAQVENQYKRRTDLIPNLVSTVQGAADFQSETLQAVTEARAAVGRAQLPSDLPTDQAKLDAYVRAQQNLGATLGRLFAVAENYPQLTATEGFRDLQSQLEGTENRITVAREDYTIAVRKYNTNVRRFPRNLVAGVTGFDPLPQFTIDPAESAVPKVEFPK